MIPRLNVNYRCDMLDSTCVISAIKLNFENKIVQLLLDCGADPNLGNSDKTPLLAALDSRNYEFVELLLQRGANPNVAGVQEGTTLTPLTMAIAQRHTVCVEALLRKGAHADGQGAEQGKPLTSAVLTGQQEVVSLLLAHGGHPDGSFRNRPLHIAIARLDYSTVRLLLDAGADAKAKDDMDRNSLYMLCLGVKCPLRESLCETSSIAKALLEAGADMNATDVISLRL